jgi:uncharacterized membrane protein YeaQ/YmgE (transglycosylase-associated protein family)
MLEHIAEFTAWPILTGILVGYVANRIMSGEGKGCCMNLIMGVIGSYAGTFISHLLNIELMGKGYLTRSTFGRFACKELRILCSWGYYGIVDSEETV